MSLWFQPKPRSVLYCDFTGFRVPEMTKRRPVVVLRPHKRNRKLVYVVPLSTAQARDTLCITKQEFDSIRKCVAMALGFSVASHVCDGVTVPRKFPVDVA
jgi:uncharacterized protein YifN (PemK superfamily)